MNVRAIEQRSIALPDARPAGSGRRRIYQTTDPGSTAVVLWALLFVVSLALAVIGRLTSLEALALSGGVGVVFFGLGGAPFQLMRELELYARLAGSVLVGSSVLLLVGMAMADIRGLWSPAGAALLVLIPSALLHMAGVTRVRRRRVREPAARLEPEPIDYAPELTEAGDGGAYELDSPEALLSRARWSGQRLSLRLTLIGTACWFGAALLSPDPQPGYWGMLTAINPLWYVGLLAVLLGFVFGRSSELRAALAALSFGLATTLTPALVYGAPREQTAAKQMQLVQYLLVHHHLNPTAGIYRAFSTLFAAVAGFSQLLGIHGMLGHMSIWSIGTYWPVMLVLCRIAVLRFMMGRVLLGSSRRWTAVMLVLLVDSLGADYFSPQAIGYVMAVGIVAFAMHGRTRRPFGPAATFALLLLAGAALAPTHELSPYMAAGALVVLAIFGQAPWWSCLPVGVPALVWAGVVHRAVSQNFSFGALFNISNFRPPVTVSTPGLQRMAIVGDQSHLLLAALLMLIALGAIGFFTHVRERWVWGYALCPIVGIALIAINPYGNEGIFRATLFAIPWMAAVAMSMLHPGRWRLPGRRPRELGVISGGDLTRGTGRLGRHGVISAGLMLCLTALLGTFLVAAYAMDGTDVLPRGDVAVTDYLEQLPSRNAYVLSVGSASNPADGAPSTMDYHTLEWSQVATGAPVLQQLRPTAAETSALAVRYGVIASTYGATPRSPLYLIWARSSAMYANAYGLQSWAEMQGWLRLLKASPSWKLVDRSGQTYLFRLV